MKTNLIYVFADQWRYHAMGCVNQDQVQTPNMDRFAQESLQFDHAYSTNCKIGLEEKLMLKPQETCIGNVLKDSGYQTAYIGKWHLDASEQNFCEHPESGAEHWDAYTPPGERRQGFDYWLSYGACDDHLNPHYWQFVQVSGRQNMRQIRRWNIWTVIGTRTSLLRCSYPTIHRIFPMSWFLTAIMRSLRICL